MANLLIQQVKELYYKQGLTAQKTGEELGTTASVVYKFMKRKGLTRRTFQEINKIRFERTPLSFKLKTKLTPNEENLRIAGIMLYWGEGAKSSIKQKGIDFANSNSEMIKVFLKFLRIICGVNEKRLRMYLYCYIDQNIGEIKEYWSRITKIPLIQFTKPYIRKDFHKEKIGKMKYGLAHVRYSDKRLLLQIEQWIEGYCGV